MERKADENESKFIKVSEKEFDELKKNGFQEKPKPAVAEPAIV